MFQRFAVIRLQQSLPFEGSEPVSRRAGSERQETSQPRKPREPAEPLEPAERVEPLEPLLVRSRRARRYILRVADDGSVRVTMPRWGSRREAREFAAGQRQWIERQRARLANERANAPALSAAARRELIARARTELPQRLQELASRCGLRVARISVRNQRWRWGSCSPNGHICLNWRLVAMPAWVRDYVLIHELMHLKRMDHSKAFWKLVAAACPEYQRARAWLRHARQSIDPSDNLEDPLVVEAE